MPVQRHRLRERKFTALSARDAGRGPAYFYEQAVDAGSYQLTVSIDAFGSPTKVFTVVVPPTDAGITFAIPVYPSVDWN